MKTHKEHVRRVREKHGIAIKVVGRYTHSRTKVQYRCRHGLFWSMPNQVECGAGCKQCGVDRHRLTHEQYVARVSAVHGDRVVVVGRFVDSNTKLRHRCNSHGEWLAKPANIVFRKSGCPLCYRATVGPRLKKAHAVYAAEARRLGITVLDRYKTSHTPIRHKCKRGHVWETKPNQLLSGYGCPLCDQSQYKRRPVQVGQRRVMVQGAEGQAINILLEEERVRPADLAFTSAEGRPTFRYRFAGKLRVYVPDFYIISCSRVVEVKSPVTLGIFDARLYAQVRAKAHAVLVAGYGFRLALVYRARLFDLGRDWYRLSWRKLVERFRRRCHVRDRRLGRNRRSKS